MSAASPVRSAAFRGHVLVVGAAALAALCSTALLLWSNQAWLRGIQAWLPMVDELRLAQSDLLKGYLAAERILSGDQTLTSGSVDALLAQSSARIDSAAESVGHATATSQAREALAGRIVSMREEILRFRRLTAERLAAPEQGGRLELEQRRAFAVLDRLGDDLERDALAQLSAETQRRHDLTCLMLMAWLPCLLALLLLVSVASARRRQAEDKLRDSRENLSVTLNSIGDAVIACDRLGLVTLMNPVAEQLTGWPPEEARGRPLTEVFAIRSAASGHSVADLAARVLTTGQTVSLAGDPVLIARDGTERRIADSASPVHDSQGRTRGVVVVFTDVTETHEARRRLLNSELRFRMAIEQAPYPIMLCDENGRVQFLNRTWSELTGYALADLPTLEAWLAKCARFDRKTAATSIDRWFKEEQTVTCRDGATRVWNLQVTALEHAPKGSRAILCMGVDITRRKEIEVRLEEEKRAAEAANLAKTEFLANMSHEIRTPLNGVLGMLQLLRLTELTPKQDQYAHNAIVSAKRLTQLLSDVLDLSRVEAGKLVLYEEPFDLRAIGSAIKDIFAQPAQDKGLALRIELDPRLPDKVVGDEGRLRQIAFNLVGNALKYTEQGDLRVELSLVSPPGQASVRLLLTVEDSGIGIPDRYLDIIFKPFAQVDGSQVRRYEGAGLGLSIVKRLVSLLGGTICVVSHEGQGTAVHVSLPFRSHVERNQEPDEPEPRAENAWRVLLVEDDPLNQLAALGLLEQAGCAAVTANDGRHALTLLAEGNFDCVFMDIRMPVMDGVAATRAIRDPSRFGDKSAIPIIAMTAHAMVGDRERFLAAGLDDYVAKPLEAKDLMAALQRVKSRVTERSRLT